MDSIIVSDYLTPILVFSVLSFITLWCIIYYLLYYKLNCSKDSKVGEQKKNCDIEHIDKLPCGRVSNVIDVQSVYFADYLKTLLDDLSDTIEDDLSLHQDCILALNDRLNLIEEEIKKIKKVGKKNGSKN